MKAQHWWVCPHNAQGGWKKLCGRKAMAIMRLARERAITLGMVIQSHPKSKNEGVWMHLRVRGISMHHTQILMPVQDPNASHAKLCAENLHSGEAFQKYQHFLTPVQAPNASQVKSLCLYRFPTIQIIAYAGAALHSSNTLLCGCRFPALHMQILMLVQVPNNSKNCLRQGRLPTIHTQTLTLVQVPNASHAKS
ncbi:hypothetical protein O181_062425 [Austropuccinia psidii MF-1]|uniref:Uncharacterized protein n=1 Tax=Austropuccinia psidii MF-1 TaxID=1389203 RepID=A0A9Q3EPA6_9BASI|nr:hypothetical protein [Austropuccinia psidii MF-1]